MVFLLYYFSYNKVLHFYINVVSYMTNLAIDLAQRLKVLITS